MYLVRDFTHARDVFTKSLSMRPDDPAAMEMINRIENINPEELPADWDGSVTLTTK
jgi:hypothetical protein